MEYILVIVHLIICLVMCLLIKLRVLNTSASMLPALFLLPVFGALLIISQEYHERKNKMGSRDIGMDNMKVSDVKYQSIATSDNSNVNIAVPLEEAILVNDSGTRRRLMMDILQHNPKEYVYLLQKARMSDDTELTHYATTTMMEIQSSYELRINELEEKLSKRSEDRAVLREYRKELQEYLKSGLLSGSILSIYQDKLSMVLLKLKTLRPDNKRYALEYIENCIERKLYEEVETQLIEAKEKWSEDERIYQDFVQYYWESGQGIKIKEVLNGIKEKEVYLSFEGKKWFEFWNGKVR